MCCVIRVPFSASGSGYSSIVESETEDEMSRRLSLASRLHFYSRLDRRPDSSLVSLFLSLTLSLLTIFGCASLSPLAIFEHEVTSLL